MFWRRGLVPVVAAVMLMACSNSQIVPVAPAHFTLDSPPNWNIDSDLPAMGTPCTSWFGCTSPDDTSSFNPEEDIQFLLHTRRNPMQPQVLRASDLGVLQATVFNPQLPTKLLVHGWHSDVRRKEIFRRFKDGYLSVADVNVIGVDWSKLANGGYTRAAAFVPLVGREVARLVDLLVQVGAVPSSLHLVGHSLGAHVLGVAGANASVPVGRITGLDPAGWLFEIPKIRPSNERLDRTSAQFVDVVHSCAGLLGLGIGYSSPLGHADFYPNRGEPPQPGCSGKMPLTCSHERSATYFVESITSPQVFYGVSCTSWEAFTRGDCDAGMKFPMGAYTPPSTRGVFYVQTNMQAPFAVGEGLHSSQQSPRRPAELLAAPQPQLLSNQPSNLLDLLKVPVVLPSKKRRIERQRYGGKQ